MPNTTPEYWEVDGQSLQTYAFNITTWGDDRQAPPPLRGENITVPHAVGRKWVPKIPDSQVRTLTMWVLGANEDGSAPVSGDRARLFKENWSKLRKLLWDPYRELEVTKRIRHPDSGLWVPVTGRAQYVGGLVPSMVGGAAAVFTVDLYFADPFFYGDEEVIEFTLVEETQEFVTLGDSRTEEITIEFDGALVSPKLTTFPIADRWVQYDSTVAAGDVVRINVRDFKALHDPASGNPYKAAGNVKHSGSHSWLYLDDGPSGLVFSAISGSGRAKLSYLPRWL